MRVISMLALTLGLACTAIVARAESGGSGGASAFDPTTSAPPSPSYSSSPAREPTRQNDTTAPAQPDTGGGGMTTAEAASANRIWIIVGAVVAGLIALNLIVAAVKRREKNTILRLRVGWERPGDEPWTAYEAIARSIAAAGENPHPGTMRKALGKVLGYAAEYIGRKRPTMVAVCEELVLKTGIEKRFKDLTRLERMGFDREVLRATPGSVRVVEREASARDPLLDEDGDFGVGEAFVVTLLIATAKKTRTLPETIATPDELRMALLQIADLDPESLRAVELVWSPAAKSDIMTRDDLERRYPDLAPFVG